MDKKIDKIAFFLFRHCTCCFAMLIFFYIKYAQAGLCALNLLLNRTVPLSVFGKLAKKEAILWGTNVPET